MPDLVVGRFSKVEILNELEKHVTSFYIRMFFNL